MDSAATRANDSARVLIMKWIRKYWKEQNDEGKFAAIVVAVIYVCLCCVLVKDFNNRAELRQNHLYCYGIVENVVRNERRNYTSTSYQISYIVAGNVYSHFWDGGIKETAHLGDTVLVMYNPKKPSVHIPVEYDGRFVTKRMVDFRAYPIDKTLIQYGPHGQIIFKSKTPDD